MVRALQRRDTVSLEECDSLAGAIGEERTLAAGDAILRAHTPTEHSTLLIDGFISREFHTPAGAREIVAVHGPGDFVDLHSMLLKALDHDVVALTPVRIATVPHMNLRRISETSPHLTRLLWFLTTVDAAIHRQWYAARGKSAAGRIAHLLCELQARLAIVGHADASGFALPLTQADLGDMTGLTAIHVNRTLRKLREGGLTEMRGGRVMIADLPKLQALADFDPAYLYIKRVPS